MHKGNLLDPTQEYPVKKSIKGKNVLHNIIYRMINRA